MKSKKEEERIPAPFMLLFGASGRNLGKTELAVRMIRTYREKGYPVAAVKVITVHNHGDICPRGGKGCGICRGLKTCFDIRTEQGDGDKDTMRFRKAGAEPVFLVRAYPEGLKDAMAAVLAKIPQGQMVVAESNSAAAVVEPGAFFMIMDESQPVKPSAQAVIERADEILQSGDDAFDRMINAYGPGGRSVIAEAVCAKKET